MSELRVRVAAYKDASFDAVFRSLSAASRDAARVVDAEGKRQHDRTMTLLRARLAEERKINADRAREIGKVTDHARKLEEMSLAAQLRAKTEHARKEREVAVAEAKREAREVGEIRRRAEQTHARAKRGEYGRDMAYRMGYSTMRNFAPVTPVLSYAGRLASDIARGAGIDFSLGSGINKAIQAEKVATDLSNAGYIQGDRRNNKRVEAKELVADAQRVGLATATDTGAALAGLQTFTGVSGDLATGREILQKMAEYSRATGSNLEDMMGAAGNVATQLGDVANKGELIQRVMAAVAGQGKEGAVEIKDLSTQMAKIAASAPQFEGSVDKNMALMGALAQEARSKGAAASSTQAATSVLAFMNTFSKGKRLDAWRSAGIETRGAGGLIRNPKELIVEALNYSKGDARKMNALVQDSAAKRAVRGFENIYKSTEGPHEKKIAAVIAEFDRLEKAAIDEVEMRESFARSMETAEAKSQQFQNQLQQVTASLATQILPKFEQLAPTALSAVEGLGKLASWTMSNPLEAGFAALSASIAKAGLDQVLRAAVEDAFKGGKFGSAITIATAAITAYELGTLVIDKILDEGDPKHDIKARNEAGNSESELKAQIKNGRINRDTVDKATEDATRLAKRIEKKEAGNDFEFSGDAVYGFASTDTAGAPEQKRRVEIDEMKVELSSLLREIRGAIERSNWVERPDAPPAFRFDQNPNSAPEPAP